MAFKGGIYIFEKNIKCTLEICALLCTYIKSQQTGLLGEKKKTTLHKKSLGGKTSGKNIDYFTFLNTLNIL